MTPDQLTAGSMALEQKQTRIITIQATERPQDIKLRVAAYARVSSSSEDQLNSFTAQTRYYTDLITQNEQWTLVDIYADEGITGTSAEKREDFQRLLTDCRRGHIDKVLVKSISRFARNTKECLEAIRELKAMGIAVCFEKENIDTTSMSGEMLTTLFATLAQAESESISKNMRGSYHHRMVCGTFIPPYLPYGYVQQGGAIHLIPEQAEIVKRIFREYLAGRSTTVIAQGLRLDQIPCKSGRVAWDSTAIRYIISNEKYIGNSVWQKYYTTDVLPYQSKRNRGEHESYFAIGTHEAIISEEDFKRANELMARRAQKIALAAHTPYPLRKKVFCGECGALYRQKEIRGKRYWTCIDKDKGRTKECASAPILQNEIYSAFLRLYYNLKNHGESILREMLTNLQSIRNRRMLWSVDIVELNKLISNLTRQNQMLAALKQRGLVDPDIFIAQSNELAEQLRAAKLEKERLLDTEGDEIIAQTRELIELLDAGPDFLDTFDGELFGELIDKIIVDSPCRLRFRLKNGLELTEQIERTVR